MFSLVPADQLVRGGPSAAVFELFPPCLVHVVMQPRPAQAPVVEKPSQIGLVVPSWCQGCCVLLNDQLARCVMMPSVSFNSRWD